MSDFIHDTWTEFNRAICGKSVYLFGVNGAVKMIDNMHRFGNPWNVVAILDNDVNKSGGVSVHGNTYNIYSPEEILSDDERKSDLLSNGVILICSTYTKEIATQLESLGMADYYSELWMNRPSKLKEEIVPQLINDDKIEYVKTLINDPESVQILEKVVEKRKLGDIDYTDLMYRGNSEYFIEEYWNPFTDGVYIDGGAYNGDTIEEIAFWTKNTFKKIYSFEPQTDLAHHLRSEVLWRYGNKVEFFEKGLWSCETNLLFENGNDFVSGKVTDRADCSIRISTCTVDSVVKEDKIDFIKLDIEGAEVEALYGAKHTICRDKPCMAICIYHKPSHLWEVPILIHELVPEYKFHIRHCGVSMFGTVLYAVL